MLLSNAVVKCNSRATPDCGVHVQLLVCQRRDAQRYRGFLGINKEAKNIADSQKTMKSEGDPVSRVIGPDNLQDIAQARKDIPADK